MKEKLYQQLHETITAVKKRGVIIVIGDMNTNIGPNSEGSEYVMRRHGIGYILKMVNYLFSYVLGVT